MTDVPESGVEAGPDKTTPGTAALTSAAYEDLGPSAAPDTKWGSEGEDFSWSSLIVSPIETIFGNRSDNALPFFSSKPISQFLNRESATAAAGPFVLKNNVRGGDDRPMFSPLATRLEDRDSRRSILEAASIPRLSQNDLIYALGGLKTAPLLPAAVEQALAPTRPEPAVAAEATAPQYQLVQNPVTGELQLVVNNGQGAPRLIAVTRQVANADAIVLANGNQVSIPKEVRAKGPDAVTQFVQKAIKGANSEPGSKANAEGLTLLKRADGTFAVLAKDKNFGDIKQAVHRGNLGSPGNLKSDLFTAPQLTRTATLTPKQLEAARNLFAAGQNSIRDAAGSMANGLRNLAQRNSAIVNSVESQKIARTLPAAGSDARPPNLRSVGNEARSAVDIVGNKLGSIFKVLPGNKSDEIAPPAKTKGTVSAPEYVNRGEMIRGGTAGAEKQLSPDSRLQSLRDAQTQQQVGKEAAFGNLKSLLKSDQTPPKRVTPNTTFENRTRTPGDRFAPPATDLKPVSPIERIKQISPASIERGLGITHKEGSSLTSGNSLRRGDANVPPNTKGKTGFNAAIDKVRQQLENARSQQQVTKPSMLGNMAKPVEKTVGDVGQGIAAAARKPIGQIAGPGNTERSNTQRSNFGTSFQTTIRPDPRTDFGTNREQPLVRSNERTAKLPTLPADRQAGKLPASIDRNFSKQPGREALTPKIAIPGFNPGQIRRPDGPTKELPIKSPSTKVPGTESKLGAGKLAAALEAAQKKVAAGDKIKGLTPDASPGRVIDKATASRQRGDTTTFGVNRPAEVGRPRSIDGAAYTPIKVGRNFGSESGSRTVAIKGDKVVEVGKRTKPAIESKVTRTYTAANQQIDVRAARIIDKSGKPADARGTSATDVRTAGNTTGKSAEATANFRALRTVVDGAGRSLTAGKDGTAGPRSYAVRLDGNTGRQIADRSIIHAARNFDKGGRSEQAIQNTTRQLSEKQIVTARPTDKTTAASDRNAVFVASARITEKQSAQPGRTLGEKTASGVREQSDSNVAASGTRSSDKFVVTNGKALIADRQIITAGRTGDGNPAGRTGDGHAASRTGDGQAAGRDSADRAAISIARNLSEKGARHCEQVATGQRALSDRIGTLDSQRSDSEKAINNYNVRDGRNLPERLQPLTSSIAKDHIGGRAARTEDGGRIVRTDKGQRGVKEFTPENSIDRIELQTKAGKFAIKPGEINRDICKKKPKSDNYAIRNGDLSCEDKRYLTGIELLLAGLATISAVARARADHNALKSVDAGKETENALPGLSIENWDGDQEEESLLEVAIKRRLLGNADRATVLTRPKYMVQPGDTLTSIAEEVMHDAMLGWLILQINAGSIKAQWNGDICLTELEGRQEIELPIAQDIVEYYRSRPSVRFKNKRLVTTQKQGSFDREILVSNFRNVINTASGMRKPQESPAV